jgi:hypothetical protein
VAASSGGRYVDLVQLRSGVDEGVSGPISGTLGQGNFTASDFTGRLNVDQMSDLLKLIIDGNAYVRVQTTDAFYSVSYWIHCVALHTPRIYSMHVTLTSLSDGRFG